MVKIGPIFGSSGQIVSVDGSETDFSTVNMGFEIKSTLSLTFN